MNNLISVSILSYDDRDKVLLGLRGLEKFSGYLNCPPLGRGVNGPALTRVHGNITTVTGRLFVDVEGSFHSFRSCYTYIYGIGGSELLKRAKII